MMPFTAKEIWEGRGQTNWKALPEMTEEEILEAARSDPDAQPTDLEYWEDAVMVPPLVDPKQEWET